MEKFKKKIDEILWMIMWLLPVIGYIVAFWRVGNAPVITTYIDENFAWAFIKDILDNVFETAFGTTFVLNGFLSYLVGTVIAHVMFDIVVFIPRFAHDVIDFACNLGKKWGGK